MGNCNSCFISGEKKVDAGEIIPPLNKIENNKIEIENNVNIENNEINENRSGLKQKIQIYTPPQIKEDESWDISNIQSQEQSHNCNSCQFQEKQPTITLSKTLDKFEDSSIYCTNGNGNNGNGNNGNGQLEHKRTMTRTMENIEEHSISSEKTFDYKEYSLKIFECLNVFREKPEKVIKKLEKYADLSSEQLNYLNIQNPQQGVNPIICCEENDGNTQITQTIPIIMSPMPPVLWSEKLYNILYNYMITDLNKSQESISFAQTPLAQQVGEGIHISAENVTFYEFYINGFCDPAECFQTLIKQNINNFSVFLNEKISIGAVCSIPTDTEVKTLLYLIMQK
jgi:hypothetical protein